MGEGGEVVVGESGEEAEGEGVDKDTEGAGPMVVAMATSRVATVNHREAEVVMETDEEEVRERVCG